MGHLGGLAEGGWVGLERATVSIVSPAQRRYAQPEDVFHENYDRLVQALTIIAGDREVAADAVQEAFVRLTTEWDRIAAYEDQAGWVRRVAVNRILDHRRSLERRARLVLRLAREPAPPTPIEPSDHVLWHSFRTLPRRQRAAVALHYVADLTRREVADAMGVSEGTVDQHLHRALEKMRAAIEEER
jgi:RNA polymerase sigma-70 factor, ECF subfamily